MRDPALAPAIMAGLRSTMAAVRPEMNPTAAGGWQRKEGGHTAEVVTSVTGWRCVRWQDNGVAGRAAVYMLQCTLSGV